MRNIVQFPLRLSLSPLRHGKGVRQITVSLENATDNDLHNLKVKLVSEDPYCLTVNNENRMIASLGPRKKEKIAFELEANGTGYLYLTVDGTNGSKKFHAESGSYKVVVGKEAAELLGLFSLTEAYPRLGKQIRVEAIINGRKKNKNLLLQVWVETPHGQFEGVDFRRIYSLDNGEQKRLATEWMPRKAGLHLVHAVLMNGEKRLGHEIERVWVEDTREK